MVGGEDGEGAEGRRIGGIPVDGAGWQPIVGETEPRILGMPTRWVRPRAEVDARWLRHPVRYMRWRREVRRLGPHARSFDEWSVGSTAPRDVADRRVRPDPGEPRPPGP